MLRSNAALAALSLTLALVAVPAVALAAQSATAPGSLYAQAQALAAAEPEPPAALIDGLTRDLGITGDQAAARLVNESAAAAVEPRVRGLLGASFGGAWVTGATSALVVATTDAAQVPAITEAGAQAQVVAHSLAALDAAKARLDSAKGGRSVVAWFVDLPSNSVVVLAGDAARARRFVDASGADRSLVRVQVSAERPRALYDIRGGDAYYIGSGTRCSVGFSITRGATNGFVSAGHCAVASNVSGSNRVALGTFQGSSFPGNDYSWVAANAQWVARGVVVQGGSTIPVAGSTPAVVGSSVCRSGSTTGWHCGTVQQLNTSVTYQEGTVSQVTRTNVCAEPGDSGGSFISGSQAQGVTSGGSGNCSSGGTTYFQPVNEILQTYGLTLVTNGGGPTTPPPGGGTWAAGTSYAAGAQVTYGGATYRCLQGHTAQVGWEPPNVPALWQRL
ncbi:alpha-lytic protease prodomain-containing protein [Nonomuraea sp. NBC_01738]|uniref:carbohydrate-binding protein n=1 Tax=Nonomuraea sp. NBC_01738 TaxID=2976003 RepID=UPI002E0D69E2|nr:alpha-lytic protease prodomain-containing protein [Nonomuraea sp. NBC_01738]